MEDRSSGEPAATSGELSIECRPPRSVAALGNFGGERSATNDCCQTIPASMGLADDGFHEKRGDGRRSTGGIRDYLTGKNGNGSSVHRRSAGRAEMGATSGTSPGHKRRSEPLAQTHRRSRILAGTGDLSESKSGDMGNFRTSIDRSPFRNAMLSVEPAGGQDNARIFTTESEELKKRTNRYRGETNVETDAILGFHGIVAQRSEQGTLLISAWAVVGDADGGMARSNGLPWFSGLLGGLQNLGRICQIRGTLNFSRSVPIPSQAAHRQKV